MFKKLLPFVIMAFVGACANTQGISTSRHSSIKMSCCEKCSCCQSGACGECCKDGQCSCCKDGSCTMCQGTGSDVSSEECPLCDKAEREWKARHDTMKP